MLLGLLPWSIGIVRLPWMAQPLFVRVADAMTTGRTRSERLADDAALLEAELEWLARALELRLQHYFHAERPESPALPGTLAPPPPLRRPCRPLRRRAAPVPVRTGRAPARRPRAGAAAAPAAARRAGERQPDDAACLHRVRHADRRRRRGAADGRDRLLPARRRRPGCTPVGAAAPFAGRVAWSAKACCCASHPPRPTSPSAVLQAVLRPSPGAARAGAARTSRWTVRSDGQALASRVRTGLAWNDLVLPAPTLAQLEDISAVGGARPPAADRVGLRPPHRPRPCGAVPRAARNRQDALGLPARPSAAAARCTGSTSRSSSPSTSARPSATWRGCSTPPSARAGSCSSTRPTPCSASAPA